MRAEGVRPTEVHADGEPLVRARGLLKAYATEPVVKGIDFEVRRGECIGFL